MNVLFRSLIILVIYSFSSMNATEAHDNKWYLGVGYGTNSYEYVSLDPNDSAYSQTSWEFNVGYQLSNYVDLEMGYKNLGGNELNFISGKAISFSALGTLPIKKNWEFFGELGFINQILPSNRPTGQSQFFGVGTSYLINNKFTFQGLYRRYANLEGQSELLSPVESNYLGIKFLYHIDSNSSYKAYKPTEITKKKRRVLAEVKTENIIKPVKQKELLTKASTVLTNVNSANINSDTNKISIVPKKKVIDESKILKNQLKQSNESQKKVKKTKLSLEKDLFYNMRFSFDSATLSAKSLMKIDEIGTILSSNPATKIEIHGHASPVGSADYNLQLSIRRANAVVIVLSEKYGIATDRITMLAHGASFVVVKGITKDSNRINQRVEIKLHLDKAMFNKVNTKKKDNKKSTNKGGSKDKVNIKSANNSVSYVQNDILGKQLIVNGKFNYNSWEIDSQLSDYIKIISEYMHQYPNSIVEIDGHASITGNKTNNMIVSLRRARAVAEVLHNQYNIESERIIINGYGATMLIISKSSDKVDKINQRISAQIILDINSTEK